MSDPPRLATFSPESSVLDRRGVGVALRSRFGDVALDHQGKHGFGDVVTLTPASRRHPIRYCMAPR